MPCRPTRVSAGQACGELLSFRFQSLQEVMQSRSIEFPVEGARFAIAQFLVQPKSLLYLFKAGEVVRRQDLSLDDREIDLHLIQPTGMHGRVDENRLPV